VDNGILFGINLSILKALQTAKEWAAAKTKYRKRQMLYDWASVPFLSAL